MKNLLRNKLTTVALILLSAGTTFTSCRKDAPLATQSASVDTTTSVNTTSATTASQVSTPAASTTATPTPAATTKSGSSAASASTKSSAASPAATTASKSTAAAQTSAKAATSAVATASKSRPKPTPTPTPAPVPTPAPAGLNVNFNSNASGTYSLTQAAKDFGNVSYWNAYNTQITNGMLSATMQANVVGPTGGAMSLFPVTNAASYTLNFDVMFDKNFDFSWGGKVGFGLFIGDGTTGGVPGWDGNGGSVRMMWYKNTSTSPVILKPYVYYKDQPGTYGDDFGKTYPSNGSSIQTATWYHVKIYAKSNTGSNTDGHVTMVINGTTVLDQAIRWSTNDAQRLIKNVCFENFRGGSESYWASPTDGKIYYDNISWQAQ